MKSMQRTGLRLAATGILVAGLAGCAASLSLDDEPVPGDLADLALHTARLEAAVRRDRARLIEIVALPRAGGAAPLSDDPELREISLRLPRNERRLAALAAAANPPPRSDDSRAPAAPAPHEAEAATGPDSKPADRAR